MVNKITLGIYHINYGDLTSEYVECLNVDELCQYLAEQQVNGKMFLTVKKLNEDGTKTRVAIRTNKLFKRILKAYQTSAELVLQEMYWKWKGSNTYEYRLQTRDHNDTCLLMSHFFCDDCVTLEAARSKAQLWIKEKEELLGLKITVVGQEEENE